MHQRPLIEDAGIEATPVVTDEGIRGIADIRQARAQAAAERVVVAHDRLARLIERHPFGSGLE